MPNFAAPVLGRTFQLFTSLQSTGQKHWHYSSTSSIHHLIESSWLKKSIRLNTEWEFDSNNTVLFDFGCLFVFPINYTVICCSRLNMWTLLPFVQMQNRMVVLLCNERPVETRGIVNQAMLMCASSQDKLEILDPPNGAIPGDRVTFQGFPGTTASLL